MDIFQSSLLTSVVLSLLQVVQGSAQFSSSASLKRLSSALDVNQTRLQGSTKILQTSQDNLFSAASSQPPSMSSPTCIQPRSLTDPNEAALQSLVASNTSMSRVCNPKNRHESTDPWAHTFYALNNTYYFNISLQDKSTLGTPNSVPSGVTVGQDCSNSFRTILSSCTTAQTFWGGWIANNGVNYTSK